MIINKKVVKKMKNKNKNNLIKWSVILILTLLGALNIARNASLMQVYPISDLNIKPAIKFEVYEIKQETIREVTMYSSTPEQTDSSPCIGASTQDQCVLWRNGQNICATNAFEKGTVLHVDKLGECLVMDRMNSRFSERIDWYAGYDDECLDGIHTGDNCPNYQRAKKFSVQKLNVRELQ